MLNPDDPGWEDVENFQAHFNMLSAKKLYSNSWSIWRVSDVCEEEKNIYFCGYTKLDAYKLCFPPLGKMN